MKREKMIRITCKGAATLPIGRLKPLQGDLKTLSDEDYGKLKTAIARHGFSFPELVWKNRNIYWIVDGHQRVKTVLRMMEEGWRLPQGSLPIDFTEASNKKEAYEKILLATSQYGKYTEESITTFIKTADIDFSSMKLELSMPQIDLEKVELGLFSQEEREEPSFAIFSLDEISKEAFRYFRKTGFPYRDLSLHVQMQEINKLASLQNETAKRSIIGYQTADTYHKHRFELTAANMISPFNGFNDDKLLKRAIEKQVESGKVGEGFFTYLCFVSGVQACRNFRPAFAMYIYRTFAKKNAIVLDPSAGFGGRLLGWFASQIEGKYIGVDPSTKTYLANKRMAQCLGFAENIELIKAPFEDCELKSKIDLVFTSPPYFAKEEYSREKTQSYVRYKTFDSWLDNFLYKLLEKSYKVLKKGKFCIINYS